MLLSSRDGRHDANSCKPALHSSIDPPVTPLIGPPVAGSLEEVASRAAGAPRQPAPRAEGAPGAAGAMATGAPDTAVNALATKRMVLARPHEHLVRRDGSGETHGQEAARAENMGWGEQEGKGAGKGGVRKGGAADTWRIHKG